MNGPLPIFESDDGKRIKYANSDSLFFARSPARAFRDESPTRPFTDTSLAQAYAVVGWIKRATSDLSTACRTRGGYESRTDAVSNYHETAARRKCVGRCNRFYLFIVCDVVHLRIGKFSALYTYIYIRPWPKRTNCTYARRFRTEL